MNFIERLQERRSKFDIPRSTFDIQWPIMSNVKLRSARPELYNGVDTGITKYRAMNTILPERISAIYDSVEGS